MKRILVTALLLCTTLTAFAGLGESEFIIKLRYFPIQPIKLQMLDNDSALSSHMLIYRAWGAYYFEVISSDTVICEGVWANSRSRESPDSVLKRFEALYGEGQAWNKYDENPKYRFRTDEMFGIYVPDLGGEAGSKCTWVWTMVGGTVTTDIIHRAWAQASVFIDEARRVN